MSNETSRHWYQIPLVRDAMVAAITGGLVLGGQFVVSGPNQTAADASYIDSLGPRITELETRVQELNAENTELRIQIAVNEAAIDPDFDFKELLCSIMEAQPGLNWAKIVHRNGSEGSPKIEFIAVCIDAEYRARFDVGPFQYVGQTDFDFWPRDIAQEFYENDLEVLRTRKPLVTFEEWVRPDGARAGGQLTKFYYQFKPVGSDPIEFILGHLPENQIERITRPTQ